MSPPALRSVLLASRTPDSLRTWYERALGVTATPDGFLDLGGVGLLIDGRDDVAARPVEPARVILNMHVTDAAAAVQRLEAVGGDSVAELEYREAGAWFATFADPDGNYVQIVEITAAHGGGPLGGARAYSGFSVDDLDRAERFYRDTLGVRTSVARGLLTLHLPGGRDTLVYPKANHEPATFTVLNFPVPDVAAAVDELSGRGIRFLRYDGMDQDERGINQGGGPLIAWFTDPAGNVLSIIEDTD